MANVEIDPVFIGTVIRDYQAQMLICKTNILSVRIIVMWAIYTTL